MARKLHPVEVPVRILPPERFQEVLEPAAFELFQRRVQVASEFLAGRVVWSVNSTAAGGGVAEMLRSLLAYARGAGVDARWVVIEGEAPFFQVTKRIHNHLHGFPGDGGPLGSDEHAIYRDVLNRNAAALLALVRPQDVVLLHDPQTAGLSRAILDAGAIVVWRCHVGLDRPNPLARSAWAFLRPYVEPAHAYVFSRRAYAWEGLDQQRVVVIPPSIDAFSAKNQGLTPSKVRSILAAAGLVQGQPRGNPSFRREDGSPAVVRREATFADGGPPPPARAPLVVQVSRWDRLKDPIGVVRGFARFVGPETGAHLIVAGPAVEAVADDPEGLQVLEDTRAEWQALPGEARYRVHLACLPMDDGEENAAMVNALQRRADVVVQKSLAEGFGLTVAEAMWKSRAVVASHIGGIQDQVLHDRTGILVDPKDLKAYGTALSVLLGDPRLRERLGTAAREWIRSEFLGPRHLMQYLDLFEMLFGT